MPDALQGLPDTHAHLSYVAERNGEAFLDTLASYYDTSSAFILDPGIEYDDFPSRKAMLAKYPFVYLAAGIWPDTSSLSDIGPRVAILEQHVQDPECIAVGECGLDYHWMNGTREQQLQLFRTQVEMAVRYNKPLIVHSRMAHKDTLEVVKSVSTRIAVIIHCFGYNEAAAMEYLDAGCYISFAGNITYKKSNDLRSACVVVPDSRLLLETDSPYMNPEPMRGKNSSPLDICRTYQVVSELRSTAVDKISTAVLNQAKNIFSL